MTRTGWRPLTCLVTDRRRTGPAGAEFAEELEALTACAAAAAAAGVDLIQVREPDLDARDLERLVASVVAATRPTSCKVVVNDRADVALAAGADGVHLRASGAPVSRVRSLGAHGWIVGRSAHNDAELALATDADYVIFGTVFPTSSKPGIEGQGIQAVAAAARAVPAPVLAIGGVVAGQLPRLATTGAAGVAAISLFLPEAVGGLGPAAAVRAVRRAFAVALT